MLNSSPPIEVNVNITTHDIGLRSNLTTNKIIKCTEKFFSHTNIGFTQSHAGPLGDIEEFFQKHQEPTRVKSPLTILETIKLIQNVMQSKVVL